MVICFSWEKQVSVAPKDVCRLLAYVAGAWKLSAQEKTRARGDTRVSLARARSLFRPLPPNACYAG